jgi:hypothetical protein
MVALLGYVISSLIKAFAELKINWKIHSIHAYLAERVEKNKDVKISWD